MVAEIGNESVRPGLFVESPGTYGTVIRFLAPLVILEAPSLTEDLKAAVACSLGKW